MNKILFVCLSSYQPQNTNFRQRYDRQELYAVALWNLIQQTKGVADICVVENTSESIESFENDHNRALLSSSDVTYKLLINNNALGSKNKGAGEFQMCMAVLDQLGDKLLQYEWIVYYTSRHVLYRLPEFTSLLLGSQDDIMISNPAYIFPDGTHQPVAPGNYNDMLFAMKPAFFKEYCLSMNPEKLVAQRMNSEAHLYNFVQDQKKTGSKVHELADLWLVRYDYALQHMHLVSNDIASYSDFEKVLSIYKGFYGAFPSIGTSLTYQSGVPRTLHIVVEKNRPSFFTKMKRALAQKPDRLFVLESEYHYDIEPTWVHIEKMLTEGQYTEVAFPEHTTSSIYSDRLKTYFAHKALGEV